MMRAPIQAPAVIRESGWHTARLEAIAEGLRPAIICITGKWRASWENETGAVEHVDLDPLDVISFPPGAIRRFENVTHGDPDRESILMFVIGGNAPRAEFTDRAMAELDRAGVWPQR